MTTKTTTVCDNCGTESLDPKGEGWSKVNLHPREPGETEIWPDAIQTMTHAIRGRLWAEQAHRLACAIGTMPASQDDMETEDLIVLLEWLLEDTEARPEAIQLAIRRSRMARVWFTHKDE